MSSYAATGRISRARPRFVGPGHARAAVDGVDAVIDSDAREPFHDPRSQRERLAERWWQVREEWGQATFFLFDPNSWR
jgi:hypothetical protein